MSAGPRAAIVGSITRTIVEELGLIWPDEAENMHREAAEAVVAKLAAWLVVLATLSMLGILAVGVVTS